MENETHETGEKEVTVKDGATSAKSTSSQSRLQKKPLSPSVYRPASSLYQSPKTPSVRPASSLSSKKGSVSSTSSRDGSSRTSTAASSSTRLKRNSSTMSTASSSSTAANYAVKTTMLHMARRRVGSESDLVTKKKSSTSNVKDLQALMLPKVENASDDRVGNFNVLSLGFNFEYWPMYWYPIPNWFVG